MTRRLLAAVVASVGLLALLTSPARADVQPRVINGTPGSPLAPASVAIETDDGECTAALWKPRILVTAAHCVHADEKDGGPTISASQVAVYPPGADKNAGPAAVNVTQVLSPDDWGTDGKDIAFLILDRPLATPIIARLATDAEVASLSKSGAAATYVGYGVTSRRDDPNTNTSKVPLSVSSHLSDDGYGGGIGVMSIFVDGVHGTCAGDSGGPWLATIGSELVLLGPEDSGSGPPCDDPHEESSDQVAVASAHTDLIARALAAAGDTSTPAGPTTCVVTTDGRSCVAGRIWTYDYCWSARRATLQIQQGGAWHKVSSVVGPRSSGCERSSPYAITFSATVSPGAYKYRIVLPRQPGLRRGEIDPFSVTSS